MSYNHLKNARYMEMKGATGERWRTLREQAQTGQDPKKFMALVQEIEQLLSEKEARLGEVRQRKVKRLLTPLWIFLSLTRNARARKPVKGTKRGDVARPLASLLLAHCLPHAWL
jgi:hypothetical protein